MKSAPIKPGDIYQIKYPYHRPIVPLSPLGILNDKEPRYQDDWKPGALLFNTFNGDTETIAHGEGTRVVTVIDVYKPPGYQTRVFFLQYWKPPTGDRFGKKGLRTISLAGFRKILAGYRYPYKVEVVV